MYKFWRDYIWVCLLKKYDTPQWLQNVRRFWDNLPRTLQLVFNLAILSVRYEGYSNLDTDII
jgi:hypothetical protein